MHILRMYVYVPHIRMYICLFANSIPKTTEYDSNYKSPVHCKYIQGAWVQSDASGKVCLTVFVSYKSHNIIINICSLHTQCNIRTYACKHDNYYITIVILSTCVYIQGRRK